jgi:hypothetical protein
MSIAKMLIMHRKGHMPLGHDHMNMVEMIVLLSQTLLFHV